MKKDVKQTKKKETSIKTTVDVVAICTSVNYKGTGDRSILLEMSEDKEGNKGHVRLSSMQATSGFPNSAKFNDTDEIRRCLDHFDEVCEINRKQLGTVIDFKEVEETEE